LDIVFLLLLFVCFCFCDNALRLSVNSDPSSSPSQVLGLQAHATMLGFVFALKRNLMRII
jgi:hypothetical protein